MGLNSELCTQSGCFYNLDKTTPDANLKRSVYDEEN